MEEFRRRVTDDFSPRTLADLVAQWEKTKPARRTWGVWRGDELGGLVVWEPWPTPGIGESSALFKRSFWGRDTARTALRLVYGELFADGVRKILSLPFRHNCAIVELQKSVGARVEGRLREQTYADGKPIGVLVLGLLKEDFEKCHGSTVTGKISS
jgi:RimJ/RimL family protein N-acetyltransferase